MMEAYTAVIHKICLTCDNYSSQWGRQPRCTKHYRDTFALSTCNDWNRQKHGMVPSW